KELWQSDKETLRGKDGNTILHITAFDDNEEILRIILSGWLDNLETLKSLINDCETSVKYTVLHVAIIEGNFNVAKLLVKEGANVNAKTTDSWTVLHLAVEKGHIEIVKWLIEENGADINEKIVTGSKATHLAAGNGHLNVLKWLFAKTAVDVNDK